MRMEYFFGIHETRRSGVFLGGLVLLAWACLAAWQGSAYAGLLGHEALEDQTISFAWHLAAFLLSWLLMTVAMMLPGSLPMLLHDIEPAGQRPVDAPRAGLILAAYLLPWLLVGFLLYLGDSLLHHLAEPPGLLAPAAGMIPPALLLLAGLYQLSPLKGRSLALCRPDSHARDLSSTWEHAEPSPALARGLRLGSICIASCGPLMLLMFALGHHRLEFMLLLSGILAAERLASWGPRLAWVVGAALIAGSVFWMFTA